MSDPRWPRPPRLIAPASGPHQDDPIQTPSNSRHFSAGQASSDDSLTAFRKHKTTACETCKQKKLKCRGGPPCDHCVSNGFDCQIDELSDMRRKGAIERKIEMLEDAERLLLDLVETLKDDQNVRTSQLINLIRSNASLDEIRLFLERQFSPEERETMPAVGEMQNHLSQMPTEESRAGPGRGVMAIQRLADIPVYRVPAKPWTNVTDDDDLVSHLVSIWCTWSHPWFHWINRDLFIRDMQAGDLEAEFCSPFLVNTILAETSLYSDYPEVFTIPGDMVSRGTHFHEEARRLLEEEAGLQHRLATIQGLATLFPRLTTTGKDRIGWVYLDMAIRAAKEYGASHPYRPTDEESARTVEDAINETLWGIFNICCTINLCTLRHIDIEPPQRPRPPVAHEGPHDSWTPYPKQLDPIQGHLSCVFHRWCDLCCIMNSFTRTFFGTEGNPSLSEIPAIGQDIQRQLQGWYTNLPDCLRVEETTVPHVLNLHVFYNTITLQICGFLRSQASGILDPVCAARMAQRFDVARRITSLLVNQRRQWGTERMHPSMIQCVAVSCFTLLEGLDSLANRESFVVLCTVARDFGRQVSLARGVLQMVEFGAKQMGIALPPQTYPLFREFDATGSAGRNPLWYNSLYLSALGHFLQDGGGVWTDVLVEDIEKPQPDWVYDDEVMN